jgi:nicotinamide riboside kinase
MSYLTLTPAHGRDYKSQKAVKDDWLKNKDFVVATLGHPTYINKQDADRDGVKVMIRYQNLTKITNV